MTIQLLSAQIVSPFNNLAVVDTSTDYSFIVSGHFHGASTNISTFPAASLQANIDTLNALKPSFLISLGDLFLDVNETYIQHYQKSLFNKLKMPLFNAVGNHDLAGDLYEKQFGKTFFSFIRKSELYIVLNTELNDGSIKNEQFQFFKNAINSVSSEQIKNIFIFSHRPVWAEQIPKYKGLFSDNTRSAIGSNNFSEEIKPLLQTVSKSKHVVWISGSMGGLAPASFFYDKDDESCVTYMQTAIRDLPRDAVLKVNVNNGKISFNGISFTGQQLEPIENYNLKYWSNTIAPEQHFNYRLLPMLAMQMITHYFFWIGFISGVIFIFLAMLIIKKWKRKK
jgi:hypothetical protein